MPTEIVEKGIKREVRELAAYSLEVHPHRVKLNQNESPFDVDGDIKRQVLEGMAALDWARYPSYHATETTAALSAHLGWPAEGLLLGNGSNELLLAALTAIVWRGRHVVIAEPCFPLYRIMLTALGAGISELVATDALAFPFEAARNLLAHSEDHVLLLASPNNPTGAALTQDEVAILCNEAPSLVILDNAYGEFSEHDYRPLLGVIPNLILLRSFSKAWSMAGLRAGYLMADPEIVREIAKVQLPYSVNLFTELAIRAALAHPEPFQRAVAAVVAERGRLSGELGRLPGVRVHPSQGNFLLVELPAGRPAREVFRAVAALGVLVRDVSGYVMLDRCLRITVGTPAENDACVAALATVLAEENA